MAIRLRIRSLDDTSDALVVSTRPGDANPYIAEIPHGDGHSFDPLTGATTTGSYTILVIDAETAPGNRVVTGALADSSARMQLLSRKAFIEIDRGSGWSVLIAGYITAIRLVDALTYEIAVGDTRRVEMNRTVWKETTSKFNNTTLWMGGPVMQDWGPLRSYGGWRFKVTAVRTAQRIVEMIFERGFDPRQYKGEFTMPSNGLVDWINELSRSYFEESDKWKSLYIEGHFPRLAFLTHATNADPATALSHTPLGNPTFGPELVGTSLRYIKDQIFRKAMEVYFDGYQPRAKIWMLWTGDLPSVGQQFSVYLQPREINGDNPIHVRAHPVDLAVGLLEEAEVEYDPASAVSVKNALGRDLSCLWRFTASKKLQDSLVQDLYGPFGFSARVDSQGRQQFFTTRQRGDGPLPSQTITLNDLRNLDNEIFQLEESTIVNELTFVQEKYAAKRKDTDKIEADGVVLTTQKVIVENTIDPESDLVLREHTYEIPAQIEIGADRFVKFDDWVLGIGSEIFDRYGRGAIRGHLQCLPTVTAKIGDNVILDLPYQVNAVAGQTPVAQRGGQRIVQIVKRTETVLGPDLEFIDAGSAVQLGLAPTFTLTKNPDDPRKFVTVNITNIASLIANGADRIRIEAAFNEASPSSGTMVGHFDPHTWSSWFVSADAGALVAIRMRAERAGRRPSAYTAWSTIQLDAIDRVTGLTVSAQNADDITRRLLRWSAGANASDLPIEILERFAGETTAESRVIATLPAGSTRYEIRGLDAGSRVFSVRHREIPPYRGASPRVNIAVVTTGTGPTLSAPIDPAGFSGELDPVAQVWIQTGVYGIEVAATVAPGEVEIAVAEETGVGSNTPGDYLVIDQIPSISGARTRWEHTAPNDGKLRYIRARHVGHGKLPSDWTVPVVVLPWSTRAPILLPVVRLTATPVGGVSPKIELSATSERPATIRIYRSLTNPATEADTLVGTSLSGTTSYSINDSGLAEGIEYYYLAAAEDFQTGISSDSSDPQSHASALFPDAADPVPELTDLSVTRITTPPPGERWYRVSATAAYANTETGNAIRFLRSENGVDYSQVSGFQAAGDGSGAKDMTQINIVPPVATYTLYIKAELRATASPSAPLLSERVRTTTISPI